MNDEPRGKARDTPLNPALKSETDTVYDTEHTTPAPIDTTSAKEGEGEAGRGSGWW